MLPNLTGVFVGLTAFALTWKPVPGVENSTPRGEFALKKLLGSRLGAESASGTSSQFISRLPVPNEPATLGLRLPRLFLKAFSCGVMATLLGILELGIMLYVLAAILEPENTVIVAVLGIIYATIRSCHVSILHDHPNGLGE